MCYDYKVLGCDFYVWEMIVGEEKVKNIYVKEGIDEQVFIKMWIECDVKLFMLILILLLVQVNMCVGYMLEVEDNGICYFKILLNVV